MNGSDYMIGDAYRISMITLLGFTSRTTFTVVVSAYVLPWNQRLQHFLVNGVSKPLGHESIVLQ